MPTVWQLAERAPDAFFAALPDVHPLAAQVLYARGLRDPDAARAFLSPGALPVFTLPDFNRATARLLQAIRQRERIAVYGDYDCDGVTACAVMTEVLRALGAQVRVYIPDRFEEGYGLNLSAVDRLHAEGVSVIVTVDCGARAFAEAERARALGVDLIITDHHEPEDGRLPRAFAVVNPKLETDVDAADLAGVGVAFQLATRLLAQGAAAGMLASAFDVESLLDLVAVGTVADVVPVMRANRALVQLGLRRLNRAPRLGLAALAAASRLALGSIRADHVGFVLSPRLNAAGRLDTAMDAFALLTADDAVEAQRLALQLEARNRERQQLTLQISRDAEAQALALGEDPPLLFAASPTFNPGVIGLAAQRLVERRYAPAVVVHVDGGQARGSCRSIEGFHITQALDQVRDLLHRHGGHAAAAGFCLPTERLSELHQRLQALACAQRPAEGWTRVLRADAAFDLAALAKLADVNSQAIQDLLRLEPHGAGNPRPTFWLRNAVVRAARLVGRADQTDGLPPHLQLRLGDSRRVVWDAIGWRLSHRAAELREGMSVDVLAQLSLSSWNGAPHLQVEVVDFRAR
ncbi:MAG: single-stranded-DNA-specific exonuclease RecJ [Anaerolineae bacterium]|nr:single-stranded-DNA-specific exonuclease RecJ [Anaerolineae bacterium]